MRLSTASTMGCGVDARNANGAGFSDGGESWPSTRPEPASPNGDDALHVPSQAAAPAWSGLLSRSEA